MARDVRRTAPVSDPLDPIVEEIARAFGRLGIKHGEAEGANAVLRVEREENVRRVVQAYWTPFQADIPGACVGLHLEVAEPRVHWAECYLSPRVQNWYFTFHERTDGDIQLAYYEHFADPERALEKFFTLSNWYVLMPTGVAWSDVTASVDPELSWSEHRASAATFTSAAVQESLKKSTIIWLRWNQNGSERTMPVWFLYDNKTGRIFVLSGERQQTIPGIETLRECDIILRWKGTNAQVAEIPATVRVLPHGPEWDEVAEKVAEKRLNIPGLPEDTARRWRDECHLVELTLRT